MPRCIREIKGEELLLKLLIVGVGYIDTIVGGRGLVWVTETMNILGLAIRTLNDIKSE